MITRRNLLTCSATLAASASLKTTLWARPSRQRQFTVDLRAGSIGVKANQHQAIDLAAKHGFESVGANAHTLGDMSDSEISEIVSGMKQKGVVWGSCGLPVDFRKGEAKFKEDLSLLTKRAAGLQKAGVTRVGTWIMPGHDDLTYRENFQQHAARLRECAKILQDHEIRFGLEYVGTKTLRMGKRFSFVHTMRETRQLHEAIGVDNMGFILDSWHWYTAGETAEEILSLTNADVVACDLNDAPKGRSVDEQIDNQRELPATTGVIDVKSFLNALVKIGYDGPVRAEPFNKPLNQMDNDAACAATSKAIRKAFAMIG